MSAEEQFPQVILLGNGINRAFGGMSWSELLHEIAAEDKKSVNVEKLKSPAPFQAIYLTNDTIATTLKAYKHRLFGKLEENGEHMRILRQILSMNADHILTTNYSYELEYAAYPYLQTLKYGQIEDQIKNIWHYENDSPRKDKYLLYQHNDIQLASNVNKIWHIHGEARKHSSIILGHYFYGTLMRDITSYVQTKRDSYAMEFKSGKGVKIKSWIDAFILGDIYILGSGLDLSEIDLWWLINRKKREKNAPHGMIHFYEPKFEHEEKDYIDERLELIKIFSEGKVYDMDVSIPKKNQQDPTSEIKRGERFREFYRKAIVDITQKIAEKKTLKA